MIVFGVTPMPPFPTSGSVMLDGALARARSLAKNLLMRDECRVSRGGGDAVFDPESGEYVTGGTTVYEGRCRLQVARAQPANPEAGGGVFTVEKVELQVPFGTEFQVGDIALFTVSSNPALVGNKYRVTGLGEKTHATSQRFNVEVVT